MSKSNNNQIKFGAIISYISIFVNIVMGLIYTPWMINQIGQGSYAIYTLATSLITMFTIDFGLSSAVSRYVAKYNVENNQQKIAQFLGMIYKLYLIISLVVAVVLVAVYFGLDGIYVKLTSDELSALKVVYIIAAAYSVFSFPFVTLNGILTAYEQFIQVKVCELFNKIGTVILVIIALLLGQGLYALVSVNAIIGVFTIVLKLLYVKKGTRVKIDFSFYSIKLFKEVMGFSIWSTIGNMANRFVFSIMPSILGMVSGSLEIAVFGFANSMENYVYILANGINGMFLPRVTQYSKEEESDGKILGLMIRVGRFQLIVLGIIFVGLLCVGKEFIYLLMGSDYVKSYYCILLMASYAIISYPQQIANTFVIVKNEVKMQAVIFVGASVLNCILGLIFGKVGGALGASLAICIALFARTLCMNILYYKKLNINIFSFFKECHLKLLPSIVLSFCLGKAITFIAVEGWSGLLIKVFILTVIYVFIVWFFGLAQDEKSIVKSFIKK